jgi:hypothetical protein
MIFAIEAAPAAIPVKPNTAAMSAMTKNVKVQRNIVVSFGYTIVVSNSMPERTKRNSSVHIQKRGFFIIQEASHPQLCKNFHRVFPIRNGRTAKPAGISFSFAG